MGSKYATQSASGYNSSPPPDDGSQTASNLIAWATHKTKLADPVKNLADAINTALVTAMDYSVRQITASDTVAASDHMKTVEIAPTVSSSITVTLTDAATLTNNFVSRVRNSSTIAQTITRATGGDTIDGVAGNITVPAKSAVMFTVNSAANGFNTLAWAPFDIVNQSEDTAPSVSDLVPTYDVSAGKNRFIQLAKMIGVQGTAVASTSGTAITFTGIPAWAKRITIQFVGVSTSGTDNWLIQLGDSGGVENSGYLGASSQITNTVATSNYTAGFGILNATAAAVMHGTIVLTLENASSNTWCASGVLARSDAAVTNNVAGRKSTSSTLDRVSITTTGGTDTFDAGEINILYA